MPHSRTQLFAVVAVAAVLHLVSAPASRAQSETDPGLCRVPASQAIGVSLQIAPVENESEFREGEVIALSADYSTNSAGDYSINIAEMSPDEPVQNLEVVCVSPDAQGLTAAGHGIGFSSAYSANVDLLANPQHFQVDVNAWHTLKPGSYRVYVESRRIKDTSNGDESPSANPVVLSNAIEIRVVEASSPWQAHELAIAVSILNAYAGAKDYDDSLEDAAAQAATALRYLCTEDAAREMARRYGTKMFDSRFRDGLLTTPYRQAAIEEMNAAIGDPDRPITSEFLAILAELETPPGPRVGDGNADNDETIELLRRRDEALASRIRELHIATLAALPSKAPEVRAGTAIEAVARASGPFEDSEKRQLVDALVSSWDFIPSYERSNMLERDWDLVASPDWLPLLRAIVDGRAKAGLSNDSQEFSEPSERRDAALYHLYELSPDEGRERILREIAHPSGAIDIETLSALSDREIPQLDSALLAGYRTGKLQSLEAKLIARYASAAIFPALKADFESHRAGGNCSAAASMLRYFLRVKPDYGVKETAVVVGAKGMAGDCRYLFHDLGADVSRPEIENLAIRDLYNPDEERIQNAAFALSEYGSAAAEAALWGRLDDFRKEREKALKRSDSSRESDGDPASAVSNDKRQAATDQLEWNVIRALLDGHGWLLSADAIRSLETIARPEDRDYLEGSANELSEENAYILQLEWERGTMSYTLRSYRGTGIDSLREKLGQLPSGTQLFLAVTPIERAAHPDDFRALEDIAHSAGLSFQDPDASVSRFEQPPNISTRRARATDFSPSHRLQSVAQTFVSVRTSRCREVRV